MAEATTGTAAGAGIAPPVGANGAGGQAATVAAALPAGQTAAQYGGLRGGRARKDGLVPGSPEALAADREKDRLRKARQRQADRPDPAPLPSAGPGVASQNPAAAPGVDAVPGAEGDPPPVPWTPEMLRPLFDELIPTCETLAVHRVATKAAQARLPGEIIRDIEKDATWNPLSKKTVQMSAPEVLAKYLNKLGVSSESRPEVTLLIAAGAIVTQQTLLLKRLDKLIALANVPAQPPKPEPPKPAP
jgi:hypothetical protein